MTRKNMFRFKSLASLVFLCLFSSAGLAWNAAGHKLIAQMALQSFPKDKLEQLVRYNNAYHYGYQPKYLDQAAAWLDWVHCKEQSCKDFHRYHYIDYPYSLDGTKTRPPLPINAVSAIENAQAGLKNPMASDAQKGLHLRVLLHVVGDIHQPMHAVNGFSRAFPDGDRGGNAYALGHNSIAPNLHAYWDRGGGFLKSAALRHHKGEVQVAKRLLKKYPCQLTQPFSAVQTAKASYLLAIHEAYQTPMHQKPTAWYRKKVRKNTEMQLAQAACHLRQVLMDALG